MMETETIFGKQTVGAVPTVIARFPPRLEFLFRPARYKVVYGGRGGAKSWGAARALLIEGQRRPLRILCARELQNSIRDSVHKLLWDQIVDLKLDGFYDVQQASIRGQNGTEFSFEGIRHNVGKIKSYEGVDVCWVEEANLITKTSWEVLIPTIRKEASEIWITFNPELETDETFQRFVLRPPASATVVKMTYRDNPWFPEVLRAEMEELKSRDYDSYLNVWEGNCRQTLDGAIYADELREAAVKNRICPVPYDATKGVSTFWDLGWADNTSIWFAQIVGFDYRIIDFYQNSLKPLDHYLGVVQAKKYIYDVDWLPHDAKAKSLGTGRSIEELMRAKGRKVRIVPGLSIIDGINAARTLFPQCYFDADRCADGIQALRHYRYELVQGTSSFSRNPLHDWASHAADAFRYLAIAMKEPKKPSTGRLAKAAKRIANNFVPSGNSQGWMN